MHVPPPPDVVVKNHQQQHPRPRPPPQPPLLPPPAAAPPHGGAFSSYPPPCPPNLSTYSFVPAGTMHAPPAPFQGRIQELPPPAAAAPAQKKNKPSTSKKSKTTTSSKKQHGGQFDTKELKSFFNTIMEKILPIGFREWEVVLKEHNKDWSVKEREVRGLRQKFNRLNASKLPTGDPNCPWDVKWAKQLKRKIDEKADANLLNDVSEAEDDDAGDEEDATTPVHLLTMMMMHPPRPTALR